MSDRKVNQPNPKLKPVSSQTEGRSPAEASSQPEDDAGLVREAIAGRSWAFDRLVERYHPRAVSVAYRLVGNVHDAWDVAQEAFIRAYRSLPSLQDPARFGPWLLRIVSNLSLNFRRARRSQAKVSLDAEAGSLSGEAGRRPSTIQAAPDEPGDVLVMAETREALMGAINGLPEKQRLAILLFAVEGLPQAEVARIIGCSVELVKWNVFQARKRLREVLEAHW